MREQREKDDTQKLFLELRNAHKGERLDYSRFTYMGIWEENTQAILDKIESKIASEVSEYWNASDWLLAAASREELVEEILQEGKDEWLTRVIANAKMADGVFLDEEQVNQLVAELMEEFVDERPI